MSWLDVLSPRRKARRLIEPLVRQGLLPLEQIVERVATQLEGRLGDAALRALVSGVCAEAARRPPARPTPLDRLEAAFEALDRQEILARHHGREGRGEAYALIDRELAAARALGREFVGYGFYDAPGAQRVAQGALAMSFGPARTPSTYAELWTAQREIGSRIVGALRDQGFEVEWNGEAAEPVLITGVDWHGARDAAGAPAVPLGARLDAGDRTAPPEPDRGPAPTNIFVSCAAGSLDAHRLVAAIARRTGGAMYGDVDAATSSPAAVAVHHGGALLDLVAGEAAAGVRGLFRRRDLANDCSVLVAIAAREGEWDCPWWEQFPETRRLVVKTDADRTAFPEGARTLAVDLDAPDGAGQLLDALAAIASAPA